MYSVTPFWETREEQKNCYTSRAIRISFARLVARDKMGSLAFQGGSDTIKLQAEAMASLFVWKLR